MMANGTAAVQPEASRDGDFKRMVRYFFEEKGDPTRYIHWDAARCQRLMPGFYEAWSQSRKYHDMAVEAAKSEALDEWEQS